MEERITIGLNIKSFRESMSLSQAEVGSFLGVTREQVSYYETGKRAIPLTVLERLAELFGITLSDLLEASPTEAVVRHAFAFRAEGFSTEDLHSLASFQKIIRNYLKIDSLHASHE
ncbi:MAG: XRE family transcriptional regulator [Chloroflexi bacterium AL-W]|nr:XRE family transcriptional regulator [Chloroflexi bacterium AL-W]